MTDQLHRLTEALSGRYTVERELGSGGMAIVYLAEDLKHHRAVAVKVLRQELAAVVGADRFLREIQTTANLQHPNILPLFDSGEAQGLLYYVMPFIDGESLRERLSRENQLPVDTALTITRSVAAALAYAHDKGVVHRDIKPENILLHSGQASVADFGIALAVSHAGGERLTETGLSLGTPHYMSPEQAMGDRQVDGRSDVYSLGATLHEMLAGEPPFSGSTAQAIVGKILTTQPPTLTELRDTVPPPVSVSVKKALAKLPADRFATALEFVGSLDQQVDDSRIDTNHASAAYRGSAWQTRAAQWLLTFVVGLALAWTWFIDRPARIEPRSWNVALPDSAPMVFVGEATFGVGQTALDISPDGSKVVYVSAGGGTTRLSLRTTDDFAVRNLPATDSAFAPFFSPDGEWIAFFAGNQLKRYSLASDQVLPVAEVYDPNGADWSDEGEIGAVARDGSQLIIIPLDGSDSRVYDLAVAARSPTWLPGSKYVLATCNAILGRACVIDADNGTQRFITTEGQPVTSFGSPGIIRGWDFTFVDGVLVFASSGENAVSAVRFNERSLQIESDPITVLQGVRREAFERQLQLAVSERGHLVFAGGSNAIEGHFVTVHADGTKEDLPFPTRVYGGFSLSPDKRWISVQVVPPAGPAQLWFLDLLRNQERVWTGALSAAGTGAWHPNSRYLYQAFNDDSVRVLQIDITTGATIDTVYSGTNAISLRQVTTDDRFLLTPINGRFMSLATSAEFAAFGASQAELPRLLNSRSAHFFPEFSPDGRWLAFQSTESGPWDIYAVPYPELAPIYKISTNGGELPRWSPIGDALFFRDGRRFYRVEMTGDDSLPLGVPQLFAEGNYLNVQGPDFAVAADGNALLLIEGPPDETTVVLHVVTDWVNHVRAQLSSAR